MIQINCNVSGNPVPSPILLHDSGKSYGFNFDSGSITRGNFILEDGSPANGWTLIWGSKSIRIWLSEDDTNHTPLKPGSYELNQLKSDGVPLPAVLDYPPLLEQPQVSGVDFVTSAGRYVFKAATNYLALGRRLIGQDPPLYKDSNIQVVLGQCVNIANQAGIPVFGPETPGIYNAIHDLGTWLNDQGQLLYLVCIADSNNDDTRNLNHFNNCVAAMQGVLGFLSVGNEFWNNGFDPSKFNYPNINMPCCRGSINDEAGGNGYDGASHWDFLDVHIRRDYPKMISHFCLVEPQQQYKRAIIIGEGPKANEFDDGNKDYNEPEYFYQGGRISSAINGAVFHSQCGVESVALTASQEVCRDAFFKGMN